LKEINKTLKTNNNALTRSWRPAHPLVAGDLAPTITVDRASSRHEERAYPISPWCINCFAPLVRDTVHYYYGAHDVGPFCEACDRLIKVHTGFLTR